MIECYQLTLTYLEKTVIGNFSLKEAFSKISIAQLLGKASSYQINWTHYILSLPFSSVILGLMISSLVIIRKNQDRLLLEFVGKQD